MQSLSQVPHIHKLILWELAHDSSEAFCIWLPSTIVPLFMHWINASYIQLLSIGLFVFCKRPVCLLFHPLLIAIKLSTLPRLFISWLFCEVNPPPPRRLPSHFSPCICGSKISNFIFFVFSPQNVEVFYWCGEKQWAQGTALWWQKCIFNPCEWMEPHIPQQQALCWMAALTRLFSLLITALCLFTMDIVIYLHQLRGGSPPYRLGEFWRKYHWAEYGADFFYYWLKLLILLNSVILITYIKATMIKGCIFNNGPNGYVKGVARSDEPTVNYHQT